MSVEQIPNCIRSTHQKYLPAFTKACTGIASSSSAESPPQLKPNHHINSAKFQLITRGNRPVEAPRELVASSRATSAKWPKARLPYSTGEEPLRRNAQAHNGVTIISVFNISTERVIHPVRCRQVPVIPLPTSTFCPFPPPHLLACALHELFSYLARLTGTFLALIEAAVCVLAFLCRLAQQTPHPLPKFAFCFPYKLRTLLPSNMK